MQLWNILSLGRHLVDYLLPRTHLVGILRSISLRWDARLSICIAELLAEKLIGALLAPEQENRSEESDE